MISTEYQTVTMKPTTERLPPEFIPETIIITIKCIVNNLELWKEIPENCSCLKPIELMVSPKGERQWQVHGKIPASAFYKIKDLSFVIKMNVIGFVQKKEPEDLARKKKLRGIRSQLPFDPLTESQARSFSRPHKDGTRSYYNVSRHLHFGAEVTDIDLWGKITHLFPWNEFISQTEKIDQLEDVWVVKGRCSPKVFDEFIDLPIVKEWWIETVEEVSYCLPTF